MTQCWNNLYILHNKILYIATVRFFVAATYPLVSHAHTLTTFYIHNIKLSKNYRFFYFIRGMAIDLCYELCSCEQNRTLSQWTEKKQTILTNWKRASTEKRHAHNIDLPTSKPIEHAHRRTRTSSSVHPPPSRNYRCTCACVIWPECTTEWAAWWCGWPTGPPTPPPCGG